MLIRYTFKHLGIIYETPDLYNIVLKALLKIPAGSITTYKELALALGDKIASRAIGYIMKTNPYPNIYPCYKVVNSDGTIGGYSLGSNEKIRRLRSENISIRKGKIENFKEILFKHDDFGLFPFLSSLQRIQSYLSEKVSLDTTTKRISIIATFDLSFLEGPPDISLCAGVVYNLENKNILSIALNVIPTFMPYIPTYLAFRELPAILACLEQITRTYNIDLIILDGQGILHPRGLGIASHVGVILDMPSIGVAKSILVGKPDREFINKPPFKIYPIWYQKVKKGYLIIKNNHKIIVSPGHKISLNDALDLILRLDWPQRLSEPLPIRLAHILVTRIKNRVKKQYTKRLKKIRTLDAFLK